MGENLAASTLHEDGKGAVGIAPAALQSSSGSSTRPIEIPSLGSTGFPVVRSHATSRPEGHSPTCRMKSERTCGSSVLDTCVQTFLFG